MRGPRLGPQARLRYVATLEPPAGLDRLGSVSIGPRRTGGGPCGRCVGYDDMGFFGPWGDGPGAPEPLGAPGLVRFTPELTVAWEYPGEVPSTGASGSPGPVDDCAAIALGGDGACCFPDGSRLPAGVTMAGLGDTLDVFVGRDWYLVVVAELLGRHRERLGRARRAGGPGYASPRRDA